MRNKRQTLIEKRLKKINKRQTAMSTKMQQSNNASFKRTEPEKVTRIILYER